MRVVIVDRIDWIRERSTREMSRWWLVTRVDFCGGFRANIAANKSRDHDIHHIGRSSIYIYVCVCVCVCV